MKLIKIFLSIVSVLYPLTIVFMPKFTFIIVSILAALWGIKYLFSKDGFDAMLSLFFIVVFLLGGLSMLILFW